MSPNDMHEGLVSHLRDGIDVVRLILFKKLKEYYEKKYAGKEDHFRNFLAGAVVNRLFGTENPQEPFASFSRENNELIDKELSAIPKRFPELLIPLTDALRMHFLCNHAQGLPDYSASILAKAKDAGILLEEREVPLPRGFMALVHRLGVSYGFIKGDES